MLRWLCVLFLWVAVARGESPATSTARAIETGIAERFQTKISAKEQSAEINRALGALETVMAENPKDGGAVTIYARFCWRFGDQTKAFPAVCSALRLDPNNAETLRFLAECYLRDGKLREALDALRKAVAVEPANAQMQFDVGTLAMVLSTEVAPESRDGVVAFALRAFRNAIELDPRNSLYAQSFGEAMEAMEQPDWKSAFAAWQRVRLLNPDTDFANYHLALAAMHLGRTEDVETILLQIPLPLREEMRAQLMEEVGAKADVPASQ